MRYQRVELHNHTTESDGTMTVGEFVEYAEQRKFEWAAVTDHNTCSGLNKANRTIASSGANLKLIRGMELTTFYGHVLVLGTDKVISIEDLNPKSPEIFLQRIKKEGNAGAVGIAHPFCVGEPLMNGCRCSLEITDWSCVDYIEVFNTSCGDSKQGDLYIGNRQAFELWKRLVLQGCKLSAVTGKDTHNYQKDEPVFITYIYGDMEAGSSEAAENSVIDAILSQRTIVTKGPRFCCTEDGEGLQVQFDHRSDYFGWNQKCQKIKMILRVTEPTGKYQQWAVTPQTEKIKIADCLEGPLVAELFYEECSYSNLLAAAVFNRRNVQ